jgi:hypothetical protein
MQSLKLSNRALQHGVIRRPHRRGECALPIVRIVTVATMLSSHHGLCLSNSHDHVCPLTAVDSAHARRRSDMAGKSIFRQQQPQR